MKGSPAFSSLNSTILVPFLALILSFSIQGYDLDTEDIPHSEENEANELSEAEPSIPTRIPSSPNSNLQRLHSLKSSEEEFKAYMTLLFGNQKPIDELLIEYRLMEMTKAEQDEFVRLLDKYEDKYDKLKVTVVREIINRFERDKNTPYREEVMALRKPTQEGIFSAKELAEKFQEIESRLLNNPEFTKLSEKERLRFQKMFYYDQMEVLQSHKYYKPGNTIAEGWSQSQKENAQNLNNWEKNIDSKIDLVSRRLKQLADPSRLTTSDWARTPAPSTFRPFRPQNPSHSTWLDMYTNDVLSFEDRVKKMRPHDFLALREHLKLKARSSDPKAGEYQKALDHIIDLRPELKGKNFLTGIKAEQVVDLLKKELSEVIRKTYLHTVGSDLDRIKAVRKAEMDLMKKIEFWSKRSHTPYKEGEELKRKNINVDLLHRRGVGTDIIRRIRGLTYHQLTMLEDAVNKKLEEEKQRGTLRNEFKLWLESNADRVLEAVHVAKEAWKNWDQFRELYTLVGTEKFHSEAAKLSPEKLTQLHYFLRYEMDRADSILRNLDSHYAQSGPESRKMFTEARHGLLTALCQDTTEMAPPLRLHIYGMLNWEKDMLGALGRSSEDSEASRKHLDHLEYQVFPFRQIASDLDIGLSDEMLGKLAALPQMDREALEWLYQDPTIRNSPSGRNLLKGLLQNPNPDDIQLQLSLLRPEIAEYLSSTEAQKAYHNLLDKLVRESSQGLSAKTRNELDSFLEATALMQVLPQSSVALLSSDNSNDLAEQVNEMKKKIKTSVERNLYKQAAMKLVKDLVREGDLTEDQIKSDSRLAALLGKVYTPEQLADEYAHAKAIEHMKAKLKSEGKSDKEIEQILTQQGFTDHGALSDRLVAMWDENPKASERVHQELGTRIENDIEKMVLSAMDQNTLDRRIAQYFTGNPNLEIPVMISNLDPEVSSTHAARIQKWQQLRQRQERELLLAQREIARRHAELTQRKITREATEAHIESMKDTRIMFFLADSRIPIETIAKDSTLVNPVVAKGNTKAQEALIEELKKRRKNLPYTLKEMSKGDLEDASASIKKRLAKMRETLRKLESDTSDGSIKMAEVSLHVAQEKFKKLQEKHEEEAQDLSAQPELDTRRELAAKQKEIFKHTLNNLTIPLIENMIQEGTIDREDYENDSDYYHERITNTILELGHARDRASKYAHSVYDPGDSSSSFALAQRERESVLEHLEQFYGDGAADALAKAEQEVLDEQEDKAKKLEELQERAHQAGLTFDGLQAKFNMERIAEIIRERANQQAKEAGIRTLDEIQEMEAALRLFRDLSKHRELGELTRERLEYAKKFALTNEHMDILKKLESWLEKNNAESFTVLEDELIEQRKVIEDLLADNTKKHLKLIYDYSQEIKEYGIYPKSESDPFSDFVKQLVEQQAEKGYADHFIFEDRLDLASSVGNSSKIGISLDKDFVNNLHSDDVYRFITKIQNTQDLKAEASARKDATDIALERKSSAQEELFRYVNKFWKLEKGNIWDDWEFVTRVSELDKRLKHFHRNSEELERYGDIKVAGHEGDQEARLWAMHYKAQRYTALESDRDRMVDTSSDMYNSARNFKIEVLVTELLTLPLWLVPPIKVASMARYGRYAVYGARIANLMKNAGRGYAIGKGAWTAGEGIRQGFGFEPGDARTWSAESTKLGLLFATSNILPGVANYPGVVGFLKQSTLGATRMALIHTATASSYDYFVRGVPLGKAVNDAVQTAPYAAIAGLPWERLAIRALSRSPALTNRPWLAGLSTAGAITLGNMTVDAGIGASSAWLSEEDTRHPVDAALENVAAGLPFAFGAGIKTGVDVGSNTRAAVYHRLLYDPKMDVDIAAKIYGKGTLKDAPPEVVLDFQARAKALEKVDKPNSQRLKTLVDRAAELNSRSPKDYLADMAKLAIPKKRLIRPSKDESSSENKTAKDTTKPTEDPPKPVNRLDAVIIKIEQGWQRFRDYLHYINPLRTDEVAPRGKGRTTKDSGAEKPKPQSGQTENAPKSEGEKD